MRMREFGVRLTRFRERANLSITQLARYAGVDYMQISRYEKGATVPSLDTAVRIAQTLHITLDQLAIAEEDAVPPPAPAPLFRNTRLLDRMRALDGISAERQELALRILDAILAAPER